MGMFNSDNGTGTTMLVSPSNGCNNGLGGQDGWWIILLIIILAVAGNGFGGNGGYGNAVPYIDTSMQRGFDQAALTSGIGNLQTSLTSGFAGVNQGLCNGFANVTGAVQNGFAQSEISANARQMADMQQNFALQQQLSQCCCDNRAATADLRYTISQEACNDRQAVNDALITLGNQLNAGIQSLKDEFCNDRLARKDEIIADLRQQINERDRQASQNAQTAAILANNEAQTVALEQYLAPVPKPSYIVQNPNCCPQNYGCGCGFSA